ncbi:hypothetical protein HBB16_19150 [Pseudonocardia sp. MCCB 268]|nr:hypothetical protein [Pseudonocardia cytotoxica]
MFSVSHPHWIEADDRGRRRRTRALTSECTHAREQLAGYKATKYVVFADALPKNPSGKILKLGAAGGTRRHREERVRSVSRSGATVSDFGTPAAAVR